MQLFFSDAGHIIAPAVHSVRIRDALMKLLLATDRILQSDHAPKLRNGISKNDAPDRDAVSPHDKHFPMKGAALRSTPQRTV